jgi:hypothetical protein
MWLAVRATSVAKPPLAVKSAEKAVKTAALAGVAGMTTVGLGLLGHLLLSSSIVKMHLQF